MDLWLLFVPPRARRCREVVVRTLSGDSWSDLETHLEEEAPKVEPPGPPGKEHSAPGSASPICPAWWLCPDPDSPLTLFPLTPPSMPSGSGLTARCPTSRGSSWFHVLCPTPALCHPRGHCCAPLDILGSKSHSPLVPPMSLVASACRCGRAATGGGGWCLSTKVSVPGARLAPGGAHGRQRASSPP